MDSSFLTVFESFNLLCFHIIVRSVLCCSCSHSILNTLNILLIKILFISVLGKDNRSIVRLLQHHRKSSWHSQLTSTWLAQNQNPFVSLLSPSAEKLSFNGCTSILLLFAGIMCDQMHLFLQSDLILLPETWWWWWCSLQRFKFKWSSSFSHSC